MKTLKAFQFTIAVLLIFLIFVASAYFLYVAIIIGIIALVFFTIRKLI